MTMKNARDGQVGGWSPIRGPPIERVRAGVGMSNLYLSAAGNWLWPSFNWDILGGS